MVFLWPTSVPLNTYIGGKEGEHKKRIINLYFFLQLISYCSCIAYYKPYYYRLKENKFTLTELKEVFIRKVLYDSICTLFLFFEVCCLFLNSISRMRVLLSNMGQSWFFFTYNSEWWKLCKIPSLFSIRCKKKIQFRKWTYTFTYTRWNWICALFSSFSKR